MSDELDELEVVYANVRDRHGGPGALGDGFTDDTAAIQRAIDTRRHVLFPQGELVDGVIQPYLLGNTDTNAHRALAPVLTFPNADQDVTFLAGARLEFVRDGGRVEITGPRQTFTGLWVRAGLNARTDVSTLPAPCVLVDGADGLLLEDLVVECGSAATLLEIKDTVGVTLRNGVISGVSEQELSTGISFQGTVRQFTGAGLAVHQLGYGVVVEGTCEGLAILDSTVEANLVNMIRIRAGAQLRGLNLQGVHAEPGTYYGSRQYIVVEAGASVQGGYITACELAGLWTSDAALVELAKDKTDPALSSTELARRGALAAATTPCRVFVIAGEWTGVNVSGCFHNGVPDPTGVDYPAEISAVYEIQATATVTNSSDRFNYWDHVAVVTGDGAALLARLDHDYDHGLQFHAAALRVEAEKIGFFGATPVARGAAYTVPDLNLRILTSANARRVLATLLADLAQLGLVNCTVNPRAPR